MSIPLGKEKRNEIDFSLNQRPTLFQIQTALLFIAGPNVLPDLTATDTSHLVLSFLTCITTSFTTTTS